MSTLALGSVCNGGARDRKVKAEREPCGPGVKPKMQGSRVKHTCRMCRGLFRSLLSLVACAAHANAASCAVNSGMPCEYGGCTFSKDGTGSLSRAGTCIATPRVLNLRHKGIQSLSVGVFDGLTALQDLDLSGNMLTRLPVGVFNGLPAIVSLHLDSNALTSLPAGVFDRMTGVTHLYLENNRLMSLPVGVFDELTVLKTLHLSSNAELSCVPMLAALRSRLSSYSGPQNTCAACTSPNATSVVCFLFAQSRCVCTCNVGFVDDRCTECMSGKYKTALGNAVCTSCGEAAGNISTCAACPAKSTSSAGSSAATACTCNAGWTGPNGGLCTQCQAGKFKALAGSVQCADCVAGKYSASEQEATTCKDCSAGTWSGVVRAAHFSTCVACPVNFDSPAGSSAASECRCKNSGGDNVDQCNHWYVWDGLFVTMMLLVGCVGLGIGGMAICYVRYNGISIHILIVILIVLMSAFALLGVGYSQGDLIVALVILLIIPVTFVLSVVGGICYVRNRGLSKAVSPEIQQGDHSAGRGEISEQHNQPRTLALNAGRVRGFCEANEVQPIPVSVNESEPLSSLQQHLSSTLLQEELNLLQTASMERVRLQNTEHSQSLRQLKEEFGRVKTAGQAEQKHENVKEERIRQLEKEISEFKTVSEEAARRKKDEDDARFHALELLLAAVIEDEVAATTKKEEDPILSSKETDVAVSHVQPRQGSECVICLHSEAVMVLMPCRHLCVCESPACMLQQCPVCRAPVVEVRRIYGFDTLSQT